MTALNCSPQTNRRNPKSKRHERQVKESKTGAREATQVGARSIRPEHQTAQDALGIVGEGQPAIVGATAPLPPGYAGGWGRRSPSLSKCHNSNEEKTVPSEVVCRILSGSQAKTAFALRVNCQSLCEDAGLTHIGFLTLTVGDYVCRLHGKQIPKVKSRRCPCCGKKMRFDQVFDVVEASRRINSFAVGVLHHLCSRAVLVSERHATGAIHFHALVALIEPADIRTGYSFREVRHRKYTSVCAELKAIWKSLREKLPLYGFGRAELAPVRKTSGAVASYVSKYLEKNVMNRRPEDRRKKLVRYHGWKKMQLKANEIEWDSPAARAWRSRAKAALDLVGIPLRDVKVTPAGHVAAAVATFHGRIRAKCLDGSIAREVLGSKWAWLVSMLIHKLDLADGDKFKVDYATQQILSLELQRLAGRRWCQDVDYPPASVEVMCGQEYTRREFREYFQTANERN